MRLRRDWPTARISKFRQAAFVYMHMAILYEAAVWALWRNGIFHEPRGPIPVWLVAGGAVAFLIFWALWSWRNEWVARAAWLLSGLRLPTLIAAAFVRETGLPSGFYVAALIAVLINMWMLARAGWDL